MSGKPSYEELQQQVEDLNQQVVNYKSRLESLENKQDLHKQLFEHLLYEVHVWELVRDDTGEIKTWKLVDANPAALKVWNKKLSEVVGKITDEVFPGSRATETFLPVVKKIFRDNKPHHWEQYFEGTQQTLLMVSIPFGNMFISTGMDVTELRTAHSDRKEAMLQLNEAISAARVGLWDWDLKTDKVQFSREWKAQIGYSENEISNNFDEWQKRVHPDDLNQALKIVNDYLAKPSGSYESEFRLQHKDGSYRWILAHASLIKNEDGEMLRLVGSHIDITERKQLEMSFTQNQKMEALGTLAGGVAHDFNNLLGPILGYSELALMSLDEESSEYGYITSIETAAMRAKALVGKILQITRKSTSTYEKTCVKQLIEDVLLVLNSSTSENVEVIKQIADDIPEIYADSSEIYQLLLNLCTNALQSMSNQGVLTLSCDITDVLPSKARLTIKEPASRYIVISVEDTGQGIEPELLDQIFDPFFTTKNKSGERGTGLGLSIAARVVSTHQGFLDITSHVGKGSCFQVYLPAGQSEIIPVADERKLKTRGNGEWILYVDDEASARALAVDVLSHLGYQVVTSSSGAEALVVLEQADCAIQVVLSDYAMPSMNGEELYNRVRTLRSELPFVLVTGFADDKIESSGYKKYDGLVRKPFSIERIAEVVSLALNSSDNR